MTYKNQDDMCPECDGWGVKSVAHKVGGPYLTKVCDNCHGTGQIDRAKFYRGTLIGLVLMAVVVLGTYAVLYVKSVAGGP